MEHLQYPIGRLQIQNNYWPAEIEGMISIIETYPQKYRELTENLSESDLSKQYREGSFTIRQLVHHMADMHLINFLRVKVALTEPGKDTIVVDIPAFATTPDNQAPIDLSLTMLETLHQKWAFLLRNMTESDFDKTFYHPVRKMNFDMRQALQLYSWHTQHHLEHIKIALKN
jgi:DinB superfamily